MEKWKHIPGYRGLYSVSSFGRVRSSRSGVMVGCTNRAYHCVTLSLGDRQKSADVHRLVADAFLGPIPKGLHVNHIDGDKKNNRLSNLEIVTSSENNRHAYRTGLKKPPVGSKWHGSKLDEEKVSKIKKQLSAGVSQYMIASKNGVNQCTISDISRGITWKHVRCE